VIFAARTAARVGFSGRAGNKKYVRRRLRSVAEAAWFRLEQIVELAGLGRLRELQCSPDDERAAHGDHLDGNPAGLI
jgi:hypothetical protein